MLASMFSSCGSSQDSATDRSFYDFKANTLEGQEVSMSQYKGKVVLVVNTASKCGLTPQFEGLEQLYKTYADRGLVVIGFPCNQFAGQDPGSNSEIGEFCTRNYGVTFPMMEKIKVNGKEAHPLYKYLKKNLKGTFSSSIKWNFTKFLIDRNGKPVKRFSPTDKPQSIERYIVSELEK